MSVRKSGNHVLRYSSYTPICQFNYPKLRKSAVVSELVMISSCLLLFGSIWWLGNCFNKTFIHVIGIFMLFVFCHGVRQFVMFCFIITARKQSLRQGNIFTSVCNSFCPLGEGGLHPGGGLSPQIILF